MCFSYCATAICLLETHSGLYQRLVGLFLVLFLRSSDIQVNRSLFICRTSLQVGCSRLISKGGAVGSVSTCSCYMLLLLPTLVSMWQCIIMYAVPNNASLASLRWKLVNWDMKTVEVVFDLRGLGCTSVCWVLHEMPTVMSTHTSTLGFIDDHHPKPVIYSTQIPNTPRLRLRGALKSLSDPSDNLAMLPSLNLLQSVSLVLKTCYVTFPLPLVLFLALY